MRRKLVVAVLFCCSVLVGQVPSTSASDAGSHKAGIWDRTFIQPGLVPGEKSSHGFRFVTSPTDDSVGVLLRSSSYPPDVRVTWLDSSGKKEETKGLIRLRARKSEAIYELLPEGSVLIGRGRFVSRLLPDGGKDVGFGDSGSIRLRFPVSSIAAGPAGGFVATGMAKGNQYSAIERFAADGRRIYSRTGGWDDLTIEEVGGDGRAIVQAWNMNFEYDGIFATEDRLWIIGANGQSARKVPAKYWNLGFRPEGFLTHQGSKLLALDESLRIDGDFGNNGRANCDDGDPNTFESVIDFEVDSHGRILLIGEGYGYPCDLVRFLPDGNIDTSFGTAGSVSNNIGGDWRQLGIDGEDRPLVLGVDYEDEGPTIQRWGKSGQPDVTFGKDGQVMVPFMVRGVLDTDISITRSGTSLVSAGTVRESRGTNEKDILIQKISARGTYDSAFGNGGRVRIDTTEGDRLSDIDGVSAGGVVVSGTFGASGSDDESNRRSGLLSLGSDGMPDPDFGKGGFVWLPGRSRLSDTEIDQQGRILTVGSVVTSPHDDTRIDWIIARFRSNGTPDETFGDQGLLQVNMNQLLNGRKVRYYDRDFAKAVAIDRKGRIVAAGLSEQPNGAEGLVVARFTRDGRLDRTFAERGFVRTPVYTRYSHVFGDLYVNPRDVAIGPDNGVAVVSGLQSGGPGTGHRSSNQGVIFLFGENGKLDRKFGRNGVKIDGSLDIRGVAFDRCGGLLAGGSMEEKPGRDVFALARFMPVGLIDRGFGDSGYSTVSFGKGRGSIAGEMLYGNSPRVLLGGRIEGNSDRIGIAKVDPKSLGGCRVRAAR